MSTVTRYIILDTETTGISTEAGHRLIEIGGLEMCNRRLTGKRFHTYLNPQREVDPGAQRVHGITTAFLQDKPKFEHIVEDLVAFLQGATLIIHNAPFDVGFLNHELRLMKHSWQAVEDYCAVIDTLVIARAKHRGQKNNLDALCKRYQVDNSNRQYHGALLDAALLTEVYLAMTGGQDSLQLEEKVPLTVVENHKKKILARPPIAVIPPTPQELQAHELFLEKMLKKSGNCLWLEDKA